MRYLAVVFVSVVLAVAATLGLGVLEPETAGAASTPYIHFDRYTGYRALSAGSERGVVVRKLSDGSGVVRLVGRQRDGYGGSLTSPVYKVPVRADTFNPSWNASTPSGTWMRLQMQVRSGGSWTKWMDMGAWSSRTDTVRRHSVDGQRSGSWRVYTDTLQSVGTVFADAYRYRLVLYTKKRGVTPTVRGVFVTASDSYRNGESLGIPPLKDAWGKSLAVPARSQMIYKNGGEVWCSPTSTSMVMAYWSNKTGRKSLNQTVPAVARGTYDYTYRGNGNWPFNTGYASAFGLRASVNRFASIEQVERWTDVGIPVIASIAWNNNSSGTRLTGAPIPVSSGHLVVIRGFTRSGDVRVNDPAAGGNSGVPRTYNRAEFSRAWLKNPNSSGGVVYLLYPKGHYTPGSYAAHGSW